MKRVNLLIISFLLLMSFSCTQPNISPSPKQSLANSSQQRNYTCSCGGILNVSPTCSFNYANPNSQSISFQWEGFQNNNEYRMYIKDESHQTILLKENLSGLGYTTPAVLSEEVNYKVEIVTDCSNGSACTVYAAYCKITSAGGGPIIIITDGV